MDRKDLSLEFTVLKSDQKRGIVTLVANTGANVDRQRDNMLPGCWSKVIAEKQQPLFLWNHNVKDLDVRGKVTGLEELPPGDSRIPMNQKGGKAAGGVSGLLADVQCALETQAGRDAFALIDGGYVKEFSVQFYNSPDNEEVDRKGVRNVKLVDELFEISAVLKGASYGTAVLMSKALEMIKDGKGDDPMAALQTIHDMCLAVGTKCDTGGKALAESSVAEAETEPIQEIQPDEPTTTAAALDVTALTASVIAFSRTLGAIRGDQISHGENPNA